jgi:hypothetical protein
MLAYIRHNDGPVADPRVAANRHARPLAGLLADGNIEPRNAMLSAAVHDRNVRPNKYVFRERYVTETTKHPDVGILSNTNPWVRKDRSKRDDAAFAAPRQHPAIKATTQIDTAESWKKAYQLRPAGERALRSDGNRHQPE